MYTGNTLVFFLFAIETSYKILWFCMNDANENLLYKKHTHKLYYIHSKEIPIGEK